MNLRGRTPTVWELHVVVAQQVDDDTLDLEAGEVSARAVRKQAKLALTDSIVTLHFCPSTEVRGGES